METLFKDFYCKLCSLQFDKGIVFDMHQSIMHGIEIKIKEEPVISQNKSRRDDKSIQCHICEGTFPTRKTLEAHIFSVHEGRNPFKCNTCDASFAGKSDLKKHVSSVHERNKPFKCGICTTGFTLNSNLKQDVT